MMDGSNRLKLELEIAVTNPCGRRVLGRMITLPWRNICSVIFHFEWNIDVTALGMMMMMMMMIIIIIIIIIIMTMIVMIITG